MRSKKHEAKALPLPADQMRKFQTFRHNIRLLRAVTGLSAEQLGKELGFKKHYRAYDLEAGRSGAPKLDEVIAYSKRFHLTIDRLLYETLTVQFQNEQHAKGKS